MEDNTELDKLSHVVLKEELNHYDTLFKLIIIGDTGVGKSCLLLRATRDIFKEEHDVTIGVEFGSFSIKVEDTAVKIQIWDTAGQETFKSVTKVFFKGSHCIFLVYDITKEETFTNLESWLKEIRENATENVQIILVGNMLDLDDKRVVTKERAMEFKSRENLDGFIETSAKQGSNVKELFIRMSKTLYLQDKAKHVDKPMTQKLQPDLEPSGRLIVDNTIGTKHKRGCSC